MNPHRRLRPWTLIIAAASAVSLCGCYSHVVSAKGPGAQAYDVYEPNFNEQEEKDIIDGIDEFFGNLFGTNKAPDKKR